jgi:hypothetical protein
MMFRHRFLPSALHLLGLIDVQHSELSTSAIDITIPEGSSVHLPWRIVHLQSRTSSQGGQYCSSVISEISEVL